MTSSRLIPSLMPLLQALINKLVDYPPPFLVAAVEAKVRLRSALLASAHFGNVPSGIQLNININSWHLHRVL